MLPDCLLSNHLVGGVDILMIFMIFVVLVAIATRRACSLENVMNMIECLPEKSCKTGTRTLSTVDECDQLSSTGCHTSVFLCVLSSH